MIDWLYSVITMEPTLNKRNQLNIKLIINRIQYELSNEILCSHMIYQLWSQNWPLFWFYSCLFRLPDICFNRDQVIFAYQVNNQTFYLIRSFGRSKCWTKPLLRLYWTKIIKNQKLKCLECKVMKCHAPVYWHLTSEP